LPLFNFQQQVLQEHSKTLAFFAFVAQIPYNQKLLRVEQPATLERFVAVFVPCSLLLVPRSLLMVLENR